MNETPCNHCVVIKELAESAIACARRHDALLDAIHEHPDWKKIIRRSSELLKERGVVIQ